MLENGIIPQINEVMSNNRNQKLHKQDVSVGLDRTQSTNWMTRSFPRHHPIGCLSKDMSKTLNQSQICKNESHTSVNYLVPKYCKLYVNSFSLYFITIYKSIVDTLNIQFNNWFLIFVFLINLLWKNKTSVLSKKLRVFFFFLYSSREIPGRIVIITKI